VALVSRREDLLSVKRSSYFQPILSNQIPLQPIITWLGLLKLRMAIDFWAARSTAAFAD
jgi:hypothetical protein